MAIPFFFHPLDLIPDEVIRKDDLLIIQELPDTPITLDTEIHPFYRSMLPTTYMGGA